MTLGRYFSSEEQNKRLLKEQMKQERISAENKSELEKLIEKPTIGVIPRYIWDESRLMQLENAIQSKIDKSDIINIELIIELIEEINELIERIYKRS